MDAAYDTVESSCGAQGTAMDTLAGNALVGCLGPYLREYDQAGVGIWDATIQCNGGGTGSGARFYPVEGW